MFRPRPQFLSALALAIPAHTAALLAMVYSPTDSHFRIVAMLLIVVLVRQCLLSVDEPSDIGEVFRLYMCGYILYAHEFLLLKRLTVPASSSTPQRLVAGLRLLFSPRLHVPKKSIPPFDATEPNHVPTRWQFLCRRATSIAWMATAYYCVFHRYPLRVLITDYARPREHLLGRLSQVSGREAVVRVYTAFKEHFRNYLLMSLGHSTSSLVGVFLFQDDPADWPPLYGSLKDAYTVRRYYSHFWHRVMRTAFVSNAKFLSFRVLRISPSATISRYLVSVTALAISGIMHSVAFSTSWRCASLRPLWYYLSIAGAILVEDLAQLGYRRTIAWLSGKRTTRNADENAIQAVSTLPLLHDAKGERLVESERSGLGSSLKGARPSPGWRYLGYLWVICFECWAIPRAVYPQMICRWQERYLALHPDETL
ncbi:uncharacterized protein Z520_01023 [Fonsecaea multimorphosa CBS 102226]|uniref:Wax synthase domain-containing protein n=1 Tax=Fonsecaea multimorphosa CBS 102226 TaxID=1442371 RepID=A0A0D2K906_9EURO|nr:uncharacterized protein Z520_01023 [Fonsecaea multimorphosa CBS 102226]KIY02558.1 hypothetical protein Z520_01023 [Fonsecaea multimorphosa CBS 102226]OAL31424.1 hypothetical protein AYO22_01016 [Fonsecaea multimorphosa]